MFGTSRRIFSCWGSGTWQVDCGSDKLVRSYFDAIYGSVSFREMTPFNLAFALDFKKSGRCEAIGTTLTSRSDNVVAALRASTSCYEASSTNGVTRNGKSMHCFDLSRSNGLPIFRAPGTTLDSTTFYRELHIELLGCRRLLQWAYEKSVAISQR